MTRHLFGRHLHAEIAAGHHDARRRARRSRRGNRSPPAFRASPSHWHGLPTSVAHLLDVLGPLHEGQRDPVGAQLEREVEVACGPCAVSADSGSTAPTTLTPLRSESVAADHDTASRHGSARRLDGKAHLAVVEQELDAGLERLRKSRDAATPTRVPSPGFASRSRRNGWPRPHRNRPIREGADPKLGALQIGQHARSAGPISRSSARIVS